MRGWGSRFGAERPQRCGALSRRSRKLPAGTRGQPRLFCSRCRTARARLPPSGAPHRATRAAPLARVRHLPLLRVSASCPAVRGPAPARPPPPAPPARWGHAPAAAVGSGSAAAAVAPLLAPARGFPDGTGRSGGPGQPHAHTNTHTQTRTCRQPSDVPTSRPAVAAPGERGGGGAGLLLPSDGVAEPRERPQPLPSEGKSNVLLSKASSTLQNIPPRFCRGRGLPAPRPAKQAGSGSALRSAMACTGRHRAGGSPAAAQRPPPTAAARPLGAAPRRARRFSAPPPAAGGTPQRWQRRAPELRAAGDSARGSAVSGLRTAEIGAEPGNRGCAAGAGFVPGIIDGSGGTSAV